jgi:hypothetical protein
MLKAAVPARTLTKLDGVNPKDHKFPQSKNSSMSQDGYLTSDCCRPVTVFARSEAWICGHSLAGFESSNPAEGIDVCRKCRVLSDRGLCVGPVTRPEESYRLWCVSECNRESSIMRRPLAHWGLLPHGVGCKVNVYRTSLMMKVPNHLYVLGDT